jgi:hypothetical protein
MEEKILYILGAGASVNALPLARSFRKEWTTQIDPPDIVGLAYDLEHFDFTSLEGSRDPNPESPYNKIKDNFYWLANNANIFGDVDTYAKYLHLMQMTSELQLLKKTLSQYFAIKQILQKKLDHRYLSWLVTIMDEKKFPDNIKILSWNYDSQVELASKEMGPLEKVELGPNSSSYSSGVLACFPTLHPNLQEHHPVSLIHLNGNSSFLKGDDIIVSLLSDDYDDLESLQIIFDSSADLKPELHFVWQKGKYQTSLMERIRIMISNTTKLVVIGYSFPFFNRDVDKIIFEQLNKDIKFNKIYYQDPILDGQQLRSQFGLREKIDIVHIKQTQNFHVPFEY